MRHHGTPRDIETSNLRLLERMDDFRVAKGDPDVRGWEVVGTDGRRIGTVEHLLVDPDARRVRYLGVHVESGLLPTGGRNDDVLVPVETARLDEGRRDRVLIPQSSTEIASLTAYDHGAMERLFGGGETRRASAGREQEERRMTLSEEELAIGKRQARAGEVRVDKRVETERVHESVPVRREEARVERQAPSGQTSPSFRGEEIRIPLTREEVVTEKRAVPKEDVVVKKREVGGTESVDETVRKERADVRETGQTPRDRERRH